MSSLGKNLSAFDKAGLRYLSKIAREFSEAYKELADTDPVAMSNLARGLGVNRSAIYRRIAGDANMTTMTVGALAKALGLRPNDRIFVKDVIAAGSNVVAAQSWKQNSVLMVTGTDTSAPPMVSDPRTGSGTARPIAGQTKPLIAFADMT